MSVQHLTAPGLSEWVNTPARPAPLLLDVREPWEHEHCSIPDSRLIPMSEIPARLAEIDRDRPVVCICHHGARSLQVASYLDRQGYADVYNLTGGIDAWSVEVEPATPRY